ncbi:MAG: hypothetical protein KatS3mg019_1107 [Fimbriimonadales bacterium]|nr:MAG: hypothetical protein KatS3mg019_1107 [Fimbriimonadales bacterium]
MKRRFNRICREAFVTDGLCSFVRKYTWRLLGRISVSSVVTLQLCFAQMYIDNREASVYKMHVDAFILNSHLYVSFDTNASILYESGPQIPFPVIQQILPREICPTRSTAWVGSYAVIRDAKNLEITLQADKWLINYDQNKLVLAFANPCEPVPVDPVDPSDVETVEVFVIVDNYYENIPVVIYGIGSVDQEMNLSDVLLISTSEACDGGGSSGGCRWMRKKDPCRGSTRDNDHITNECPTAPTIGYMYGKINVATSMLCIHGFGYAIQHCLDGETILLTAAASSASDVEMVHVAGRGIPPHKANFEGRVKAKLHGEVRRSGGLGFSTAVAGVGARVRYAFSSDGTTYGECTRAMQMAIAVGQRGTLRIPGRPSDFVVEASPWRQS